MPVAVEWDVIIFLLVFVVIVVQLVRLTTRARAAEAAVAVADGNPHDALLLKFVEDKDGKRLGETVAADGDDLVVKDAKGFLAVPASRFEPHGAGLRITGSWDEADARARGEAWRERSHKVITYQEHEIPKDEEPR